MAMQETQRWKILIHSSTFRRVLARHLAEELRSQRGGESNPAIDVVTGEVRRDWSDPEFEDPAD